MNYHVKHAAALFQTHLRPPVAGKVRFVPLTLEDVIATIRLSDEAHADALYKRYCDFRKIAESIENTAPSFGLTRKRARKPEWP